MFTQRDGFCAINKSIWEQEKSLFNCPSSINVYHCIQNEKNRSGEICIQPVWVQPSKWDHKLHVLIGHLKYPTHFDWTVQTHIPERLLLVNFKFLFERDIGYCFSSLWSTRTITKKQTEIKLIVWTFNIKLHSKRSCNIYVRISFLWCRSHYNKFTSMT